VQPDNKSLEISSYLDGAWFMANTAAIVAPHHGNYDEKRTIFQINFFTSK